jgi:hypothetical protein
MPIQIERQPKDIHVLHISGILKRSEFATEQSALARNVDIGSKPRLLVILENFEGWERGVDSHRNGDYKRYTRIKRGCARATLSTRTSSAAWNTQRRSE